MPGDAGSALVRAIVPAATAFALTACSGHDQPYQQYFQVVKQGFSTGFGGHSVSREEVAAAPHASMGYRVDDGSQNLLVLGSDAGGDLLWTAKSHVVIVTREGRILRTVGLAHDIAAVTPQPGQTLPSPAAALRSPVRSLRLADFPDVSAYGVALDCSATAMGPQTIATLGNPIPTVRVDESCRSGQLRWSWVDSYWIEPKSGLVWRSLQHIHPGGETIETEIFRPPG